VRRAPRSASQVSLSFVFLGSPAGLSLPVGGGGWWGGCGGVGFGVWFAVWLGVGFGVGFGVGKWLLLVCVVSCCVVLVCV